MAINDVPDLAAEFGEDPDAPVLPDPAELGLPELDAEALTSMIEVAVDPATPDPGFFLEPEDVTDAPAEGPTSGLDDFSFGDYSEAQDSTDPLDDLPDVAPDSVTDTSDSDIDGMA